MGDRFDMLVFKARVFSLFRDPEYEIFDKLHLQQVDSMNGSPTGPLKPINQRKCIFGDSS